MKISESKLFKAYVKHFRIRLFIAIPSMAFFTYAFSTNLNSTMGIIGTLICGLLTLWFMSLFIGSFKDCSRYCGTGTVTKRIKQSERSFDDEDFDFREHYYVYYFTDEDGNEKSGEHIKRYKFKEARGLSPIEIGDKIAYLNTNSHTQPHVVKLDELR